MVEEPEVKPLPCPCGAPAVYDSEPMPDYSDSPETVVGVVICCFSCGRGVEPKLTEAEAVADWNANRLNLKPLGT